MSCELCERPAGDAYLCPSCVQDTVDRLLRLPALYAGLGIMLTPPAGTGGGRGATLVVSPLPLVPEVADARALFGVLPTWARALADDRQVPPAVPAGPDLGHQLTAACTALAAARAWIASSWPAAGDLASEVRDLHDDARTILGTPDLDARMGPCPTVIDGAPCGADLLLPHGEQVVRCRWCGATYPPATWAALKREQTAVLAASPAALAAQRPAAAGTTQ